MAAIQPVRPDRPSEEALRRAAEALARGEVIAFPTDTLYGLCARALDPAALERLFAVKGREEPKGAPVLVADPGQLSLLASEVPGAARAVMERLWPGPLTLIFPARPDLSSLLRGPDGRGVAVRLPDQALCRALAERAGPFAATSANRPGEPPLAGAREIEEVFGGRLSMIFDGGPLGVAGPSTVADIRGSVPRLLRPGGVPFEAVREAWEAGG